jgi:Uma2 family endonuclease
MNANLHRSWTQDEFFAWAEKQDLRDEFDGVQPVATTGGTMGHGDLTRNLHGALLAGLRAGPWKYYGSEAGGVATTGKTVRYPDATITCSKQERTSRLIAGPVVVFEVVSRSSLHMDHVVKVREYATVPSIRRYVMIDSTSVDMTVMERKEAGAPWVTSSLTKDDILRVPEVGIEIPVVEIYEGLTFSDEESAAT